MATKWGICGTGKIAHDFCACLKALSSSEHQIVAVAAGSSKEKAEEFAQRFDIPTSYGSYDELMADQTFEVAYISVLHPLHVELSLKFINAGKAVLCEKPMALSLEGCQKVLQAAKEKNVLFVEAFWSRFFPCYSYIKEQIDAGKLGEIKTLNVNFCLPISHVPRINNKKLGGGGLMDIGCYPVQAANFVFKEEPESIWSDGSVCPEKGVDKNAVIILRYKGGRQAILYYSTELQPGFNDLVIRGTKGTARMNDNFWNPTQVIINDETKEFPLPSVQHELNYGNSEGLTYEAQGVRHCLLNGLKESPNITHADSRSICKIMQQVLNNHGLKYDAL